MVLLISYTALERHSNDPDGIFIELLSLDMEFLDQIEVIIFIDNNNIYTATDFSEYDYNQNKKRVRITPFNKEEQQKIAMVQNLFWGAQVVNNIIPWQDIFFKTKYETIFLTSLFNSDLIPFIKKIETENIKFQILLPRDKLSFHPFQPNCVNVTNLTDFFDAVLSVEALIQDYHLDLLPHYNIKIKNPGRYLISFESDDFHKKSNFCFVGTETYFKYIVEYFHYLFSPEWMFYVDMREGLPLYIDPSTKNLICSNIDLLSFQEQSEFAYMIEPFLNRGGKVLIHSTTNRIVPLLKREFVFFKELSFPQLQEKYTELFLSLLAQAEYYEDVFVPLQISRQLIEDNALFSLIKKAQSFEFLDHFLSNEINNNIFRVEFWYTFIFEARSFVKDTPSRLHKKRKKYYMVKRGDYWLLSFGYDLPLVFKDKVGLSFLVFLMENPNKKIHAEELRKKTSKNVKDGRHVDKIREQINAAIDDIYLLETKLSLTHDFSKYLKSNLITTGAYSERTFMPADEICYFQYQNETIKWKLFSGIPPFGIIDK